MKRQEGFRHPTILFWVATILGGVAGLLFAWQLWILATFVLTISAVLGMLDYRA
ncbi:secreted protein [Rhodopirellula europaea 6C]|uniref:Secreted protein n=1 Tax=Rhodopirellula europaea 6C TaxID=1263867 RepID=M2ATQ5_9BACT|nr:secreted protein [Rhodopirellula europaea 6C]